MSISTVLTIERLTFQAGSGARASRELVRDFSATVTAGQIVGLIGANGSGKSTFLDLLAGHCEPTAGVVSWDKPYFSEQCEGIYVPQGIAPSLVPWLRVMDHFKLLLDKKVEHCNIRRVNQLWKRRVGTLSGGEKQLAMIEILLSSDWKVCLLDEPFSALDTSKVMDVLPKLRSFVAATDRVLIVVLHRLEHVAYLADEIWAVSESSRAIKAIPNENCGDIGVLRGVGNSRIYGRIYDATL